MSTPPTTPPLPRPLTNLSSASRKRPRSSTCSRDLGIAHRRIPPGCPEVNGKVERSHRTDEEEFYRRMTFRTAAELTAKLRRWEHEYNHRRPHLALAGKTPERVCELRIVTRTVQATA